MGNNGRPCIYVNKYVQSVLEARTNKYNYNSWVIGMCGSMNIITTIYRHVWFYEYNYNSTVLMGYRACVVL